jgi:electron transport complex protein RnfA
MKEMILLVLGFVLLGNYALSAGLGLVPLLGFSARREKTLALALSVTGVTIVTAVLLWLLRGAIPACFRILAAVAIVLALVYLLQLVCGKKLGLWFPLIALNSAVLGLALNVVEAESLLEVALSALGVGLGFGFALFLFEGIERRIESEHLPKAWRGFPIRILAAAIVALALTAFQF